MKIIANTGYIFQRIHDNFMMDTEIELGMDYSTGIEREDKEEYYRQILDKKWHDEKCNLRIIVPIEFVDYYPELLFDLTVIRKLLIEQSCNKLLIYTNIIVLEYQQIIDSSNGVIYIENRQIL